MNTSGDVALDAIWSVVGSVGLEKVRLVEFTQVLSQGQVDRSYALRDALDEVPPQPQICRLFTILSILWGILFTSHLGPQEDASKGDNCASIQRNG